MFEFRTATPVMKYQITHKTSYVYADLVPICHNLVHLAPRSTPQQKCIAYRLKIDPKPAFLTNRDDYFGNRTEYFSIENAHQKLEIIAESTVDVMPIAAPERSDGPWEDCVFKKSESHSDDGDRKEIVPDTVEPIISHLTFPSPRVPVTAELRAYAEPSFTPGRPIVTALTDFTARIHHEFQV